MIARYEEGHSGSLVQVTKLSSWKVWTTKAHGVASEDVISHILDNPTYAMQFYKRQKEIVEHFPAAATIPADISRTSSSTVAQFNLLKIESTTVLSQ